MPRGREPRRRGLCLPGAVMACLPLCALAGPVVPCNPPVRLDVEQGALSETLAELAEAHDFALVFPDSVDRQVTLHDELALDALLERLTDGISTSYIYADEADCSGHRIVKLVVYPVGEQGEMIRDAGGNARKPRNDRDYIYVEDMDSYVRDVMLKKQRPELNRLTPEQRVEYRMARKRLKREMRTQGKDSEFARAKREAKKKKEAVSGGDATGDDRTPGAPEGAGG